MEKLKPCPFCGETVYVEKEPLWITAGNTTHGYFGCYKFEVKCRNPECGCSVYLGKNDTIYHSETEARQNAIQAWTRRVNNDQR